MSKVDDLIATVTGELGHPYVFGAENSGPNGSFDCSGLVQWAFAKLGIKLPRTAHEQQAATSRVSSPAPGDLVFYGTPAHHVGIYIGGGKMIDAPHSGALVRIEGIGHPTNYGRVSGLGAGVASVLSPVVAVAAPVGLSVASWLGGIRTIALQVGGGGLAVALIGFGLYRLAARPGAEVEV